MKNLVKSSLLISTLLMNSAAMADSCLGKKDIDGAYKGQVEAALVGAGFKAVPRKNINATVSTTREIHDPEYNVLLAGGGAVHVTCDDSGDDQCGCTVVTIDDLKKYKGENDSPLSNQTPSHQALPGDEAQMIKSFLQKCAVHVTDGKVDMGTNLKANCTDGNTSMTESYDKATGLDTLTINSMKGELIVFGFDNTHSDGGDLTDIGVYTTEGARIGYQVAPYLLNNTLDALATLVGLDSSTFPVVK